MAILANTETSVNLHGSEFHLLYVAGFMAQSIDGSLGMGYGVSCNTLLLALGIPPAMGSASVHAAEVVTTGISGLTHWIVILALLIDGQR